MKNLALAMTLLCCLATRAAADNRVPAKKPDAGENAPATAATSGSRESSLPERRCVFGSKADAWTLRTLSERESKQEECDQKQGTDCRVDGESSEVFRDRAILVAALDNPPRTRVTLHAFNENGDHQEILWDPAAPEGTEQTVLLGAGKWRLTVVAEEQQLQTDNVVATIATTFSLDDGDDDEHGSSGNGLVDLLAAVGALFRTKSEVRFSSEQVSTSVTLSGTVARASLSRDSFNPSVRVQCRSGTIAMDKLVLDPRRAAAASTARGLLDQPVPAPVREVLSLLAEIAVARARAGAMEILRDRFVAPICDGMTLKRFRLDDYVSNKDDKDRAFPRICALLDNMRFQDVLSSGKELLAAARDDLRLTLAPKLVANKPGLGSKTRELLAIAITFANRVVDGESSQVAEVDLLVALLDRITTADALSPTLETVKKLQALADLNESELAEARQVAVEGALPIAFDDSDDPRPWHSIAACARRRVSDTRFYAADRRRCVDALLAKIGVDRWDEGCKILGTDFYRVLAPEIGRRILAQKSGEKRLGEEIVANSKLLEDPAAQCAGRLVIAIAKWCSRRDRCAAGDIGAIMERPWEFLAKPAVDSPYAICIGSDGERWLRDLPVSKERYIQLAATLVSFLAPVPAGQERARTVAMIRWMFEFVRTQSGDDPMFRDLEELVGRLVDGDYVRAITQAVVMLQSRCTSDELDTATGCSKRLKKTIQLLGAVGSYARTYEATQGLDAAEARKQRKEALEALIDSATDRGERGGDLVFSLGSNVGFGRFKTLARQADGDYEAGVASYGVRLPVGISVQLLPGGKDDEVDETPRWLGWHAGLTLADLGQFLATDEKGAIDDVRWSNFVSPGIEAGVLLGRPSQVFTLTLSASYAPALFEKTGADGSTEAQGALRFGATLGYYVPFFDLN